MNIFTSSLKKVALVAVAAFSALQANAGATFYGHRTEITKVGEGTVYANTDNSAVPTDADYKDNITLEFVSTSSNAYGWAKPAEGWLFGGWLAGVWDENAEAFDFENGYITALDAYAAFLSLDNGVTDDPTGENSDSLAVVGLLASQLYPTSGIQAVFTHVVAEVADGHSRLGTAAVSPLYNQIGDKVTVTAEPSEDHANCQFAYWELNGQQVSTEASIEITVSDTARYIAHFTSDDATEYDFGYGKIMTIYPGDDTDIFLPSYITSFFVTSDSVNVKSVEGDDNTYNPYTANYMLSAGNAYLLYGKGKAMFVRSHSDYPYVDDSNLNRWSYDGVKVDTLSTDYHYYSFDAAEQSFSLLADDATIGANEVYLALPDTVWNDQKQENAVGLASAPKTIYISKKFDVNGQEDGISTPMLNAQSAGRKGIYTLGGQKVAAMKEEGVYIYDGKKVIYRKK